jgi:PadR family transcriptional regulator PadR
MRFAFASHGLSGPRRRPNITYRPVLFMWYYHTKRVMPPAKLDLLQGTLDLMVLQTLEAMGPLHGYGIARRIEQLSGDEVLLNQGTIYASLVGLQQRGWIVAKRGVSDNNRRAKFYAITKDGTRRMKGDKSQWERLVAVMGRVLTAEGGKG